MVSGKPHRQKHATTTLWPQPAASTFVDGRAPVRITSEGGNRGMKVEAAEAEATLTSTASVSLSNYSMAGRRSEI